jgi:hypothetical protein
VHVHPGTHSADPLVELVVDSGVRIRVTLTLDAAQAALADLQRAVDYHTGATR